MQWRRLLLVCLFLGAFLLTCALSAFPLASSNRVVAQSQSEPAIPGQSIEQEYQERILNITFSTMTPVAESDSVEVPGLGTISWQAGQTPDEFLRLGNFYDSFNLQLFNLDEIAKLSGLDLSSLTFADIAPLVEKLTLRNLVDAIPGLGQWQVFEIPLVQDLLGRVLGGNGPWDEATIQQAIAQYSFGDLTVGDLFLGDLDLSQYELKDAIPGFTQTGLARLPNWEQVFINQVPGLNRVPFASFPGAPTGAGYVALFDVSYGKKEARRTNTITGSDVEGFNVPCKKNSCSYIELSGPPWLAAKALHGKQWIKGGKSPDAQMVRGGYGALAVVNGGKEPTGRHPYGRGFKVVLKRTDESKGLAEFALYFRYCNSLGCTPYFIGPVPWFTNHEDDIIFIGLTQASAPPPGVPAPPQVPPTEVGGPPVDPGGEPLAEDCLARLLRAIPADMLPYAQQSIPLILAEARRSGVSDIRQLAYMFATVQRESAFGALMVEQDPIVSNISGGIRYRGRGFVQLTHLSNYQYWSQRLAREYPGIDLVNNPERAAEPEIAVKILVRGMRDGTFTGYKLSDYINSTTTDFYNARRIVNGLNRANEIARNAQRYLAILQECNLSSGGNGGRLCRVGTKFMMPARGVRTSPYGPRGDRFHAGIDIAAPIGTAIIAGDCGTVSRAQYGYNGGYGNVIEVTHPNGFRTRYAHLKTGGIRVKQGMSVGRGQHIGDMGTTGRSTGPHLHFEVAPPGRPHANPELYL